MLESSRAEHLATHETWEQRASEAQDRELEDARAQLAESDTRLEALRDQREQTRWYQRGARAEIDRTTAGWERGRAHWAERVDRLTTEVAQRPQAHDPTLSIARDPLNNLDMPAPVPVREIAPVRELARGLDDGIGLEL
jgi:hypothetical protein